MTTAEDEFGSVNTTPRDAVARLPLRPFIRHGAFDVRHPANTASFHHETMIQRADEWNQSPIPGVDHELAEKSFIIIILYFSELIQDGAEEERGGIGLSIADRESRSLDECDEIHWLTAFVLSIIEGSRAW